MNYYVAASGLTVAMLLLYATILYDLITATAAAAEAAAADVAAEVVAAEAAIAAAADALKAQWSIQSIPLQYKSPFTVTQRDDSLQSSTTATAGIVCT
jgi:hypothetical protein